MVRPQLARLLLLSDTDPEFAGLTPSGDSLLVVALDRTTRIEIEYESGRPSLTPRYSIWMRNYARDHGMSSELWVADIAEGKAVLHLLRYELAEFRRAEEASDALLRQYEVVSQYPYRCKACHTPVNAAGEDKSGRSICPDPSLGGGGHLVERAP